MVPTPEERVEKVELAVLALAKQVFVNAAFEDKHPRAGGKFAKKAGPKLNDVQKRQIQSTVAAESRAALKKQVDATHQGIRGQNAITAQDKAKAAAAKKGGAKKAAAKKPDETLKTMKASQDAADAKAKEMADKKAAAATPAATAPVDQAQAMLDKQAADNSAGMGTTALEVADTAGPLEPQQAEAIKNVVQSYVDEAAKDKEDPAGAKLAAQAAQWAAAAAVQGGKILQKVQDEWSKMDDIASDKSKPEVMRKQAERIKKAYEKVLDNVDY